MITDNKVLEIEHYCQEHNVSRISRLKELGISKGQFYREKRRLQLSYTSIESGNFLQLGSNEEFIDTSQVFKTSKKNSQPIASSTTSPLNIELRTAQGTAMRIQGSLTPEQLREIMSIL